MPSLYELQGAMRDSLVRRDNAAIAAMLSANIPPERLDIYRNTFLMTLTRALTLSFPVTRKLVGEAFFDGAAQIFINDHLPEVAWLDQYGGAFPGFLREFSPAQSLAYLSEVAQLEWAVNCSSRAANFEPLDLGRLAAVESSSEAHLRFHANPSIHLLRLRYPVDAIWTAVTAGDDEALGKLDLNTGPVYLLVERQDDNVAFERLESGAWSFLLSLTTESFGAAMAGASGIDGAGEFAKHLARGRFCTFEIQSPHDKASP